MNEELTRSMEPLQRLYYELVGIAPQAGLFLLVLVLGLILSSLARRIARGITQRSGLEALAEKIGTAQLLYAVGFKKGFAHAIGALVYVAGLLLTAAGCAEVLGLDAVAAGVGVIMSFLPRLLAAAVVLVGGVALATAMRSLIDRFGRRREDLDDPGAISKVIYYLVITVAVVMAADQAGLQTDLIDMLVTLGVGACAASLALAFALASRSAFGNLIAGHYLKRSVSKGDMVQYSGQQGVVTRFTPVHMVLRIDQREVLVPFRGMIDEPVVVQRVARSQASGEPVVDARPPV